MKRLLLLTAIAALATAALVTATAGANTTRPVITPQVGPYEGRDSNGGHIRFFYDHNGHVTNFRIDHRILGNSGVVTDRQFHVCDDSLCAHGSWATGNQVSGLWNLNHSSHGAQFTAHHRSRGVTH